MVRSTDSAAKASGGSNCLCDDNGIGEKISRDRQVGSLTEPSAEKTIFSTFILASASLCSQCRFSSAPRS